MALPGFSGQEDEPPAGNAPSRGAKIIIAVVVVLIALVVVLHLTGVISGH
jgi:hypothetical protein